MLLSRLAEEFRRSGCLTEEQIPMAAYTSFRIGGPADLLVTAEDESAAARAAVACRSSGIPLLILGNGSNLLVDDAGIRGVVLRLPDHAQPECIGTTEDTKVLVRCPAGLPLKRLCRFARDNGLAGLEFAYGIPGTVGGAAYMNAGAYGGEMKDVLAEVRTIASDGEFLTHQADTLSLSYRHSALMENGEIVTSVLLSLMPDDPAAIGARMEDYMNRRRIVRH